MRQLKYHVSTKSEQEMHDANGNTVTVVTLGLTPVDGGSAVPANGNTMPMAGGSGGYFALTVGGFLKSEIDAAPITTGALITLTVDLSA